MPDQPFPSPTNHTRLVALLREHWGLLLLLGFLLPVRIARARLETSIWIDETYSFLLAHQPISRIVDFCATDTNPPGYFLALKAWMKLAHVFAEEPGVLWARLLNCLAWTGLAVAAWFGGRRALGRSAGALLAWTVAGSAYAALYAKDARGYSLASVALFGCFLLLAALLGGESPPRRRAVLWALYALAASVALWTHVLSALVLVPLFGLWLSLAPSRSVRGLRAGVLAHVAALGLFLPWALQLRSQVASLQKSAPTWMTPASVHNWLTVFWYWYPFGPVALPEAPPSPLWLVLGILSLSAPLMLAVLALGAKRNAEPCRDGLLLGSGIVVSVIFVTALWMLQRFGIAAVFHAPRYPGLTAAFWAAGLTGLSAWSVRRLGWRESTVWAVMAPWLLAAAWGQILIQRDEGNGGLLTLPPQATALLPPAGGTLFVWPAALAPFHRKFLGRFQTLSIDDLPCEVAHGKSDAVALDLNFWHLLDSAHDLIAREAIAGRLLGTDVSAATFPDFEKDYALYRVTKMDRTRAGDLCAHGFQPTGRQIPTAALAVALPEDQRYADGWSYPEIGPALDLRRWGARPLTTVRFDRTLPPGDYILHYRGYRSGLPAPAVPIRFRLNATLATYEITEGEGDFLVSFPFHCDRAARPRLSVEHPTWTPPGKDARTLASLLWYSWIEASQPGAR